MKAKQLTELWRIDADLQFRQIHPTDCGFLLFGGLDFPASPQSKQFAAVASIDGASSTWNWVRRFQSHKSFDYSCVLGEDAIGVIPHRFKSNFAGAMRFRLIDGELIRSIETEGIYGIASNGQSSFAYAIYQNSSTLWIHLESTIRSLVIGHGPNVKVRSLISGGNGRLISTMQEVCEVPRLKRSSAIEFLHQSRDHEGNLIWEYRSKHDTIVDAGTDEVYVFTNAGESRTSEIEVLDANIGRKIRSFRVPTSIANPLKISPSTMVYCNPQYELCILNVETGELEQTVAFPNRTPGWLSFAFDAKKKLLLAAKADNFLDAKSTIAAFAFRDH